MKSDDKFWERVNRALDERRDPLEDEIVQDAIASEPELVGKLLALRERLALLPKSRATRRIPRAAAAAAIAAALGAIAFERARAPRELVESNAQLANAPAASYAKNEILDLELTLTTERPGQRESLVVDRTGTRRSREFAPGAIDRATLTDEISRP